MWGLMCREERRARGVQGGGAGGEWGGRGAVSQGALRILQSGQGRTGAHEAQGVEILYVHIK